MNYSRLSLAALLILNTTNSFARFEAHEWGTFTSLVGSDGITQNGMYHEDEPLPGFVHGFGEVQIGNISKPLPTPIPRPRPCRGKGCIPDSYFAKNIVTQKMETPVIYFYSDREQRVNVNVKFPEGVVTETYPAPVSTFPNKENAPILANGSTTFQVDILNSQSGDIPFASNDNIYSHARNVGSNLVRSGNEQEKFIFYRGLGRFQPRFSITSQNGELKIATSQSNKPQAAFLVHVNESGNGQMIRLGNDLTQTVSTGVIRQLKNHSEQSNALILTGSSSRDALIQSLVGSGLRQDEAKAMVATWENGYLKVPGLRLLYILPRAEVDQVLPLQMTPAPDALERVFVGRIEILLDTEEQLILEKIQNQGTDFDVSSLGRFAEPMLRRVSEVYNGNDSSVKASLNSLIQQASISKIVSSGGVH